MTWSFDTLEVGERPTLLEAELANQVLAALNALGNITIEKGDVDEVLYSDEGLKIIYSSLVPGYEEKIITICEDGVAVDYTFLVKANT